MSQSQGAGPGNGTLNSSDSITSTPTRNRADSRDYLVQPGSALALLPVIAEERSGGAGGSPPPYFGRTRSITTLEQAANRYGNAEGDKEVRCYFITDITLIHSLSAVYQCHWSHV